MPITTPNQCGWLASGTPLTFIPNILAITVRTPARCFEEAECDNPVS
jgi:hypothetical protein